ncbi:MAG: SAM-dependent methyltransferase [Candidatus Micrarchaeota archaeon]
MLKTQMANFINQQGGRVRADVFVREHLMGENGFYSKQADFRTSLRAQTFSNDSQGHAERTALTVYRCVDELRRYSPNVSFSEIGGGGGEFKKEFVKLAKGGNFRLHYTSIEPNENQRGIQAVNGTTVRNGTAQKTDLEPRSVDFLFDEEVLDCLAPRILKVSFSGRAVQLKNELFVRARGDELSAEIGVAERTRAVEFFERHLTETKGAKEGECTYLSEDYWAYWKERSRVLKESGASFSVDYGTFTGNSNSPLQEMSNMAGGLLRSVDRNADSLKPALDNPYRVDYTHVIDFNLQRKIAAEHGFGSKVVGMAEFAMMYEVPLNLNQLLTLSSRFAMIAYMQ